MKKILAGATPEQIEKIVCGEFGQPQFRARQVKQWIKKGAEPDQMINLPKSFLNAFGERYRNKSLKVIKSVTEERTQTTKLLNETEERLLIESVVLSYEAGITLCVSTQAGCRMGCSFCMSGKNGLYRSLRTDEMISQVLCASFLFKREVGHIVLMGSGEPLDNYENVKEFIMWLNAQEGLNMSFRRITLSTCGIIPGIKRMIEDKLFVNLSISMHCADSEIREKMMPIERAYPINKVMGEAKAFRQHSKRRITCEYCVVSGVNDTPRCAQELKKLIEGTDTLVNLIGVNEGRSEYEQNDKKTVDSFARLLQGLKVDYTIRRKLGSSINAACGQLVSGYIDNSLKEG